MRSYRLKKKVVGLKRLNGRPLAMSRCMPGSTSYSIRKYRCPLFPFPLHAGQHVVLHQEVQVSLFPVPGGQRVVGVLDRPDDLRVLLVAEGEHVAEPRE